MDERIATFLERDDIRLLARLAADCGSDLSLVGGGVRDLLLGRTGRDLDFALAGGAVDLPRRFAAAVGGTFFWLDRERGHGRVVRGKGEDQASYDFVPLQGGSIAADLSLRDFTVNALALSLTSSASEIIDPLGGRDDLRHGLVRPCSPSSLTDDPVRLVRAFRFAATLRFRMTASTLDGIAAHVPLLDNVAAERIRDEFFKILEVSASTPFLRQLADTGLLYRMMGAVGDAAGGLGRVGRLELLVGEVNRHFPADHACLGKRLSLPVEEGVTVLSLVKLALLAGPLGSDRVVTLAERLRLGNRSLRLLRRLCQAELPPLLLLPEGRRSSRAMYRFFRDQEPAGPELLLRALVEGSITPDGAALLMGYYCRDYVPTGDLYLSGADIMAFLGTGPGPRVGEAAALLREAESRGEVNSKGEAEEFLRKNLLTNRSPIG